MTDLPSRCVFPRANAWVWFGAWNHGFPGRRPPRLEFVQAEKGRIRRQPAYGDQAGGALGKGHRGAHRGQKTPCWSGAGDQKNMIPRPRPERPDDATNPRSGARPLQMGSPKKKPFYGTSSTGSLRRRHRFLSEKPGGAPLDEGNRCGGTMTANRPNGLNSGRLGRRGRWAMGTPTKNEIQKGRRLRTATRGGRRARGSPRAKLGSSANKRAMMARATSKNEE